MIHLTKEEKTFLRSTLGLNQWVKRPVKNHSNKATLGYCEHVVDTLLGKGLLERVKTYGPAGEIHSFKASMVAITLANDGDLEEFYE